jgi:ribosome-associated heat shock protein Hsp15
LKKSSADYRALTEHEQGNSKVRIDKWLWAARFFKTRSLAKAAIEGGKVQLASQKVKVSREVVPGDILRIRQGWDEREVKVIATSEQRRAAPIAQTLYEETEASFDRRARAAEARKAAGMLARPSQRPGKHQRKALERLRKQFDPT